MRPEELNTVLVYYTTDLYLLLTVALNLHLFLLIFLISIESILLSKLYICHSALEQCMTMNGTKSCPGKFTRTPRGIKKVNLNDSSKKSARKRLIMIENDSLSTQRN